MVKVSHNISLFQEAAFSGVIVAQPEIASEENMRSENRFNILNSLFINVAN